MHCWHSNPKACPQHRIASAYKQRWYSRHVYVPDLSMHTLAILNTTISPNSTQKNLQHRLLSPAIYKPKVTSRVQPSRSPPFPQPAVLHPTQCFVFSDRVIGDVWCRRRRWCSRRRTADGGGESARGAQARQGEEAQGSQGEEAKTAQNRLSPSIFTGTCFNRCLSDL